MSFPKLILSVLFFVGFNLALFAQSNSIPLASVEDFPDQSFPKVSKEKYYSLKKEFFIYAVLEGLPQWYTEDDLKLLIQKLRPEIRELYFWSYLDGQVSNGGFSQFFENGFGYMIPEIKKFYMRVGEEIGLELLLEAEKEAKNQTDNSWIDFEIILIDRAYFANADTSRERIESYIRANSQLFVTDENGDFFPEIYSEKIALIDLPK